MSYSGYSDSESDNDYEMCTLASKSYILPYDPTSIENIILSISDTFDFRVILNDDRAKEALMVTTGLSLAGQIIGRHFGGRIGAALGSAIGGVCGLGIVAISMREIWKDIKEKLYDLFEVVYDYLAGLGLEDYRKAAIFLAGQSSGRTQLAMLVLDTTSSILGKKIVSSLNTA